MIVPVAITRLGYMATCRLHGKYIATARPGHTIDMSMKFFFNQSYLSYMYLFLHLTCKFVSFLLLSVSPLSVISFVWAELPELN